jgi:hypothetical protein
LGRKGRRRPAPRTPPDEPAQRSRLERPLAKMPPPPPHPAEVPSRCRSRRRRRRGLLAPSPLSRRPVEGCHLACRSTGRGRRGRLRLGSVAQGLGRGGRGGPGWPRARCPTPRRKRCGQGEGPLASPATWATPRRMTRAGLGRRRPRPRPGPSKRQRSRRFGGEPPAAAPGR